MKSNFNSSMVEIEFNVFDISPSSDEDIHNASLVTTFNSGELSYDTFLFRHLNLNIPCIIKGIAADWKSSINWIKDDKPNFQYLHERFGTTLVPVADCGHRYFNSQKKEEKSVGQFLDYWKSYILNEYPSEQPCYYLKDWHFMRDFPEEDMYKVPNYFGSDWLNEYFIGRKDLKDDYRFVYMGPKGSWTPFHSDVFSSFSWSVNICGKKRWVLFPPGHEKYLIDKQQNLVYDIESPSLSDLTVDQESCKLAQRYEIIQEVGDAIFVPSGWHHQVWNLEDTISVNHNWINGFNIEKMWASLQICLDSVKKEISDCRDMDGWEQHCQLMLRASYGMDMQQFCQFVLYIVFVRIEHLKDNKKLKLFNGFTMGSSHMKLDVFKAKKVLDNMICNLDFIQLNCTIEEFEAKKAIQEIDMVLNK